MKARRHEIAEIFVAAFRNTDDVIQGRVEACRLFVAIPTLATVPFIHLGTVLTDVIVVQFRLCDIRLWFRRCSFIAEFPAGVDLIGNEHPVQSTF